MTDQVPDYVLDYVASEIVSEIEKSGKVHGVGRGVKPHELENYGIRRFFLHENDGAVIASLEFTLILLELRTELSLTQEPFDARRLAEKFVEHIDHLDPPLRDGFYFHPHLVALLQGMDYDHDIEVELSPDDDFWRGVKARAANMPQAEVDALSQSLDGHGLYEPNPHFRYVDPNMARQPPAQGDNR